MWVGWITPDYHQYDLHFDMNKVRNVTVTVGDDKGNIHDRYVSTFRPKKKRAFVFLSSVTKMKEFCLLPCPVCSIKRSNCYMVWGGEFSNSQQTRVSQEDFVIGCLVDLDTGLMTFTANGKEINTFYQVRRGNKALFFVRRGCSVTPSLSFRSNQTQNSSRHFSSSPPV